MEKATAGQASDKGKSEKKPRGPKLDVERTSRQEILRVIAPVGSRFKGYKSCYVRDLVLKAELVRYRRECWVTPDGRTVLAPLPALVDVPVRKLLTSELTTPKTHCAFDMQTINLG